MLAAAYIMFVVGTGNLPGLTSLAAYKDQPSCQAAVSEVTEILKRADEHLQVVCISVESLNQMGKANNLGPEPMEPDE